MVTPLCLKTSSVQHRADDDALGLLSHNTTLLPAHLMLATDNRANCDDSNDSQKDHVQESRLTTQTSRQARRDVVLLPESSSAQGDSDSKAMAECVRQMIEAYDDEAVEDFDVYGYD